MNEIIDKYLNEAKTVDFAKIKKTLNSALVNLSEYLMGLYATGNELSTKEIISKLPPPVKAVHDSVQKAYIDFAKMEKKFKEVENGRN